MVAEHVPQSASQNVRALFVVASTGVIVPAVGLRILFDHPGQRPRCGGLFQSRLADVTRLPSILFAHATEHYDAGPRS